jgi:hypothetical protein
LSLQEKQRLKEEKDKVEAKYKVAIVDGRQEQVMQGHNRSAASGWKGDHDCCFGSKASICSVCHGHVKHWL